MINALKRCGAALSEISEKDFLQPGITFQIGIPPRRIDVITEIDGVQFQKAYPNRISASLEGISVPIISRSDLLANKRASGRPQDLVDATWLEETTTENTRGRKAAELDGSSRFRDHVILVRRFTDEGNH